MTGLADLASPTTQAKKTRNQWRRIFPISVIDNVQKVHFIHDWDAEIVIMTILIEIGSKIVFILQLYNFILY
jgi:hypothetical protein